MIDPIYWMSDYFVNTEKRKYCIFLVKNSVRHVWFCVLIKGKIMRIIKGPVLEGWYVHSSCGSGEHQAIRIDYVETPDGSAYFTMSPKEAILLAEMIKEVAFDYMNGQETGMGFQ